MLSRVNYGPPMTTPTLRRLLAASCLAAACQRAPVAPGLVVESVDRGGRGDGAGLREADELLAWQAGGAGGPLRSPFALLGLDIEHTPRGPLTLSGRREGRARTWTLQPGPIKVATRPTLPDGDPAWALTRQGESLLQAGKPTEAREAFAAAVRGAGGPAVQALVFDRQAAALERAGDVKAAEAALREGLAIRRLAAPDNLAVAHSLFLLGDLAYRRVDFRAAEDLYGQALTLRETLAPQSLAVADALGGVGNCAFRRGDLGTADAAYRRVLAMREALSPESEEIARVHNGLGLVAKERGYYQAAGAAYRRALAIEERLGTDSSRTLNFLGVLALQQGDMDDARSYFERALALFEAQSPNSLAVAGCLNNLGNTARAANDLQAATRFHSRALRIRETLAPNSLDVANSLNNLGVAAEARGDLAEAESLYSRSMQIKRELAPASLTLAIGLTNLCNLALARKDAAAAERWSQEALQIAAHLAPGTGREAEAHHGLGRAARLRGDRAAARRHLLDALDALDAQRGRGERAAGSSGLHTELDVIYDHTIELLVEMGRPEEALAVLERSRAQALLGMMADRRDLLAAELPAQLREERDRLDAEYDRAQDALSRLRPGRDDRIRGMRDRLLDLRRQRVDLDARVRLAAPRVAAFTGPRALDARGVRRALDPGTLLLAFHVGQERTVLLGVPAAGPLRAWLLPLGEEALRRRVDDLRALLDRGRQGQGPDPAFLQVSARLYADLFAPAEPLLSDARRVLISPDGPLHMVSFAALSRPDATFLGEWRPLHTTISATVYAQIRSTPAASRRGPGTLVAFGDPRYAGEGDEAARGEGSAASILAWARRLGPLPFTRDEVQTIAALMQPARVYLGAEATEERAKAVGPDARYLHFACHGLLDRRSPLDSGLALAQPPGGGGDNGLLQAWEVFERVRLDADLVTLSACDTASGREAGGEGLIGLSRAFQYAGARSVLASLWAVSDRSTAEFMRRFYGALKEGRPKDEAVQTAQRGLREQHPYHWAAFQLSGDWR
jgi:CHAT domain-containing protein/tetratricopeptide (TPR) repeat protein